MLSPQPHFLSPKGSPLSPLLLLSLLSTYRDICCPIPWHLQPQASLIRPYNSIGSPKSGGAKGAGLGGISLGPGWPVPAEGTSGSPHQPAQSKSPASPETRAGAAAFNAAHRDPPGAGRKGAPTAGRVPPPEGQKTAENKQTAGVLAAAVIFGLEGVDTLRVVLANSCKWSRRCGERWLRALAGAGLGALVLTGNPAPQLPSHLAGIALLLSPHPSEATSEGSRGVRQRPWKVALGSVPGGEGTALWPALGTGCGWDVAGTRQKPCCHRCWHPGTGRENAGWALDPTITAPVPTRAAAPLPPLPRPAPAAPSESMTVSASPWASTPQEKGTFIWRCILQENQLSLIPCLGSWGICTC